ncbi:DUF4838 domain-containing protein [Streptomyces sp. enrichment culture]|uniref:DUF4838 domain-containing protein n=1 Tax=Streptomyces sp. enrichment culture TaxID=1795815 RepID=UPI003F5617CE
MNATDRDGQDPNGAEGNRAEGNGPVGERPGGSGPVGSGPGTNGPGTSGARRRGFLAGAAGLATALALPQAAAARPSAAAAAPSAGFPLVQRGRARATVLWQGGGGTRFAATELRDYVQRITGVRLPLRAGRLSPDGAAPEGVTGFVALRAGTGWTDTLPADRLLAAGRELSGAPEDSFAVLGDDRYTVLTGLGDRAPLYAVYALLERLGVRFFAPAFPAYEGHHEYVPRSGTLVLEAPHLVDRPAWGLRRQYAEEGYSHNETTLPPLLDWMAKNRLNTFVHPTDYLGIGVTTYDRVRPVLVREAGKRGILIESGGHGYDSFLPKAEYPQYYESGGPLFDIYKPEALDAYVGKVVEFLTARPEIGIFDCWPPDVWQFQKPVLDRYGSPSNAESVVVNRLAEVLREKLPGVRVERIAYASTLKPPDPEYATDPDVIVDFAPYSRTYGGPLDAPDVAANVSQAEALRAWRPRHRGPLAMYEYYRRYRWRSMPVHPLAVIAGDVSFEAGLGLDGMGMYCEPGDWIPYEHVQNLVAALSWDPALDAGGYLDGYLHARFGPAAAPAMSRYFDLTRFDPDTVGAARLHDSYGQAREALREAAGQASGASARTVIDRLTRNADVALADLNVGLQPTGSAGQRAARREYRALVLRNRFNGVCLPNIQVQQRWSEGALPYGDARMRAEVADNYRAAAAGFGNPGTLELERGGGPATLTVEAQDVDFTGHTVTWTASAPEGVRLEPPNGTLTVQGTRGAAQDVAVTAAAAAAAGAHRITLAFRLADGTALTPASVQVTVA